MRKVQYRQNKTGSVRVPGDDRWHTVYTVPAHTRGGYALYEFQGAFTLHGLTGDRLVPVEFQMVREPMGDATGGVDLLYGNGRWNVDHIHPIAVRRGMRLMAFQFKTPHPITVVQRIAKVLR